MPVRKKENLKNIQKKEKEKVIVPRKEESRKDKNLVIHQIGDIPQKRVTALATAGKKKRPK